MNRWVIAHADYGLRETGLSLGQSSDLIRMQGGLVIRECPDYKVKGSTHLYFLKSASVIEQIMLIFFNLTLYVGHEVLVTFQLNRILHKWTIGYFLTIYKPNDPLIN